MPTVGLGERFRELFCNSASVCVFRHLEVETRRSGAWSVLNHTLYDEEEPE